MRAEGTGCHPLEPKSKGAFNHTGFDSIVGQVKSSATSRAVVVDIRDWYTSQAQIVERALYFHEPSIIVKYVLTWPLVESP